MKHDGGGGKSGGRIDGFNFFLRPTRARVSREILTGSLASPTMTSCADSSPQRIREVGDHVRLLWILVARDAARFAAAPTNVSSSSGLFYAGKEIRRRVKSLSFPLSFTRYSCGFDGSSNNFLLVTISTNGTNIVVPLKNVAWISLPVPLTQNDSRPINNTNPYIDLINVL